MNCDCNLVDFVKYTKRDVIKISHNNIKFEVDGLYCYGPKSLINEKIKNLNPKNINCYWLSANEKGACKNICTCWELREEQKIFADCSHRNLTGIPDLVGQHNQWSVELNLSGNKIDYLPSLKNDIYKNIKILDLSNNSISSISTDLFSESLQVLKLHNNKISQLDDSVIQYLGKSDITLTNLTLYGNPWEYDCDSQKSIQISFIKNNLNVEMTRCKNYKKLLLKAKFIDESSSKGSSSDNEIYLDPNDFILLVLGLALVMTFLLRKFNVIITNKNSNR